MALIINPGSGPVSDATLENAQVNIRQFAVDLGGTVSIERQPALDENGRFGFTLHRDGRTCEIEMPGLPLERVRYQGESAGHNIWHFPRLFVDGSSWVWTFAVSMAFHEEEAE